MPAGPPAPTATHFRWLAHGVFILTFYGCLIPLRYRPLPLDEALTAFRQISFFDPSLLGARGDWVVSIVQFAVLSYLYMAALCVDRRRVLGLAAAALVVPGCVVLSVCLELLQLYFPPRTVSLNDIAVESLGGVAGALFWLLAGQRLTDWTRRFWNVRGIPDIADQALSAYLALLMIVQLMPFDLTVGAGEVVQKYHEGKIHLIPFPETRSWGVGLSLTKALTNAACFLPLGVLAALSRRWAGLGGCQAIRLGLVVPGLVEFSQLFVYSRYVDVTDILTGTAAILLGWRLTRSMRGSWGAGRAWIPRFLISVRRLKGSVVWVVLFCIWYGALVLINWQPFDFTTDPARFATADGELTDENTTVWGRRRMSWAPLVDYYWGSKYNALDQFVRKILSFVPMGIPMQLMRRDGSQPMSGLRGVLLALLLGLVIESGQYFIPSRHPSTSDLLLECCGAWLGILVARHVVVALRAEAAPRTTAG
jgi:glycopeptide antibiotics resistance protein